MMKKTIILNGPAFNTGSYFENKEILLNIKKDSIKDETYSLDKNIPKKRGRKKKSKMYFSQETEDSIVKYNNEVNSKTRDDIFNSSIKYSLEKLAENVINTFKFAYISDQYSDIKTEVVSKMIIEMEKYDQSKGKAFSYFSIIAKNHLIILNNESYKELKVTKSIDSGDEDGHFDYDIMDTTYNNDRNKEDVSEFISLMVEYWDNNVTSIFKKKRDIDIAYAVVELFRNVQSLEFFNKKALYLLVREMTGHRTQYITRVINRMILYYFKVKKMYYNSGLIKDDMFFNNKKKF